MNAMSVPESLSHACSPAEWETRCEQAALYRLLDHYGIGIIATSPTDLRIAFSCLEVEEVEPLFEALHKAIQELQ